ncbi:mucin-3A-like [Mizuhopecten yessoensis]|uniref:Uncharacterized protein n=1 Tax=Mizuhopecten yessoensis TaxID=6573 RepID=A0A210QQA8_MIZYE|nr:mucin-3A-like [Mizuhopecten yessoensis]OWF50927.1 hypothetical protein KP79_PYT07451 [Mizuhopecten yessoensis]
MDKPMIGSGKLLIGKDGKLLIQGDDKVVSSYPSESHKLVTQKNADGTSNIFMVPSDGVNKGKFFLVMPQENQKLKTIGDVFSSNNASSSPASETFSNSSETLHEKSGSQLMSNVLKNIANHISSESIAPDEIASKSVENSTTASNSLAAMSTVTNIPTSSVSSYILTGASTNVKQSPECESRTSQKERDNNTNFMPSVVQSAPNVTLGASGIVGNNLTTEPSVNTIPVSPLLSMPSLPISQSVIILSSGSIPVLPMRTGGEQPLLAALNAAPLQPTMTQTSKTPAVTTYHHKPNILMKTTSSQPSTLAAMVTSCQTTITTTPNSVSSQQVPLVPVIINTNQTSSTSALNFLPNATTSVPTSSQSLPLFPELRSQTTTTYSPTFVQAPLVAVSSSLQQAPLTPVMIAPKPSMITNVSIFQQTPVTNSPLLLTAQQAATLLGMPSVPGTKIPSNNSIISFMKTMRNVRATHSVNAVKVLTSSQESTLRVAQVPGLSTARHSSELTTTTYSALTRSNSEVTGVATSVQDGKIITPVLESVDDNPVLNSNKPQELSNDQGLTYNASTSCSATSCKTTAVCAENTITTIRPLVTHPKVSDMTHVTSLSGATPMLLFSHNAARSLKPNGLPDPFVEQGCKVTPIADATTTKPSPVDAVSTGSLPAHHHGLPSVLEVKPKEYKHTQIGEQSLNINSKKFTVVRIPVSKDSPLLQRANSGNSTVSLSTGTSSYISTSCNISSSVATKMATTEISSTVSNNIKVKSTPHRTLLPQTANANNISGTLSYPTDSNLNVCLSSLLTPPVKTVITCAGSTESTTSPRVVTSVISDRVTGHSERRSANDQPRYLNEVHQTPAKPKIIVSASLAAKLKRDNSVMGNLVSIVPSNNTKKTTYPSMISLLTTSDHGYTRVCRTVNGDKDVKNDSKPDLNLWRGAEKDTGTAKLNSTVHPILKMPRSDDLPIRIDSVFSLSAGDHTSKPESVYGAECGVSGEKNSLNSTEDLSNTRKSASLNMELSSNTSSTASNMDLLKVDSSFRNEANFNSSDESRKQGFNPERSPTSSEPSMTQILREFDHLSNFNGVILPDEAITESKIFSPCYVVLETLRMHGGTMKGINTRCSRTCRQRFVSKKSNIRLAIQKKKDGFKQVEANLTALVPGKVEVKKRKAPMTSENKLPGSSINSDGINIKRSRDILNASLGTAGHKAMKIIENDSTTNGKKEGKQITPSNLSLPVKDDTSERVKPTTSQAVPVAKKLPNTEKFYLIRVDGKTVLIPCINAGSQPKAFIINEEKINLASYTVNKSSPANSTSRPNKIVLPRVYTRVSTTSSSTAASSVCTSVIPTTTKPAQVPTTTQVKVKPEPITNGYGDESEAGSQPPVIVKQERMDRGYSDEPPKLERMDTEPPKRTSHELKSKETTAPDLTAEKIVPPKIQKVLSKEERISSLKELLKKQEKDLEAIRKRRVAEATPMDLDF